MKPLNTHKYINKILDNVIEKDDNVNIIFYGCPGTSKTTTAHNFAKKYYTGSDYKNMILELNASDTRGIKIVRETINDFIKSKYMFDTKKKIIILDECDNMIMDAQNELINIMDNYKDNVIFIFICNYITKLSPGIISRSLDFGFNKIDLKDVLKMTVDSDIPQSKIKTIFKLCNGDLRKCLNTISNITPKTNINKIFNYPSTVDIKSIFNLLTSDKDHTEIYKKFNSIVTKKELEIKNVLNELSNYLIKNIDTFEEDVFLTYISEISDLENRLNKDFDEKIQLYSLISIFK